MGFKFFDPGSPSLDHLFFGRSPNFKIHISLLFVDQFSQNYSIVPFGFFFIHAEFIYDAKNAIR